MAWLAFTTVDAAFRGCPIEASEDSPWARCTVLVKTFPNDVQLFQATRDGEVVWYKVAVNTKRTICIEPTTVLSPTEFDELEKLLNPNNESDLRLRKRTAPSAAP